MKNNSEHCPKNIFSNGIMLLSCSYFENFIRLALSILHFLFTICLDRFLSLCLIYPLQSWGCYYVLIFDFYLFSKRVNYLWIFYLAIITFWNSIMGQMENVQVFSLQQIYWQSNWFHLQSFLLIKFYLLNIYYIIYFLAFLKSLFCLKIYMITLYTIQF